MVWLNNSHDSTGTPCSARTGPVRESSMFFISYGTRTGPVRDLQGCHTAPLRTHKGIDTSRIGKNPARASYFAVWGPYEPRTVLDGLFTGCLKSLNPYGAHKITMHALKLYGSRTGRQNSYGAARGCVGPVSGRTIFVQNSLWTAREQPVRGPGVWCHWGISGIQCPFLLLHSDAVTSPLTNGSTVCKWKLYCHWLISLWQHQMAVVLQYHSALHTVTSHSWALYGLFPGCFEQKWYVHTHGPRAATYKFCLPVRGP